MFLQHFEVETIVDPCEYMINYYKLLINIFIIISTRKLDLMYMHVRTYVFSLPRRHLITLLALTESWAASHDIPSRISLLVKDLIAFKIKSTRRVIDDTCREEKRDNRGHMTVLFHS